MCNNEENNEIVNESNKDVDDSGGGKEISQIINEMKENNCFKLTKNMAKVMEGQNGGGFYAAIFQDRGTKYNRIGLIIKYPNEEESELLKFSQGEFLQAGRNQFQQVTYQKGIKKVKVLPFAKKFEDTLMEYMSPRMPIWPNVVMRAIYENYSKLPVIEAFEKAPDIEEIYKYLSMAAIELSVDKSKGYINHKEFYRFNSSDFEILAKGLSMKTTSLLEVLKSYGFISRTSSSIGSQTKIKYKNETFYTYNIFKEPFKANVNVETNVEGEFPTAKFDVKYLSPSERAQLKMDEKQKEYQKKMGIDKWAEVMFEAEFGQAIRTVESSKGSKTENTESIADESSKSSKSCEEAKK